ncbi:MAG: RNA-directed DNA polymerase [Saprospiraceae bacterium]
MPRKKANHLFESVAEMDNLRLAFWKARKGKSYARSVEHYRSELENNLARLREQILCGQVEVGNYHLFKIFDPKERQICAPAFSEQVLHHALMNVCHEYFERVQVFDSYACRLGKGTYAALDRAKCFTENNGWFLKLDIRKFFDSVHHGVLKNQLDRRFKDWEVLRIFEKIIGSYHTEPGRGLPIGNLTSQYFANHFLNGLDHFVKNDLRARGYVRYMDDLVLWHDDKRFLKNALAEIDGHVQTSLRCTLKPPSLNHTDRGLTFLGYRLFPDRVLLAQNSKRRFIRKYHEIERNRLTGNWDEAYCQRKVLPLLAFVRHADTLEWRKKILLPKE